MEKIECKICGKKFDTKEALNQHVRDSHEKKDSGEKKKSPIKKYLIYAAILLVVVLFIYGVYSLIISVQKIGSGNINNFTVSAYSVFRGSDSANVTIIEFGDYQCPFCGAFFLKTEPQIMQNYVDNGKAKFYFINFAFLGPDSFTLAQGSWCANEQGKYYDFHDYVYSHQGQENTGWATPDEVKAFATDINGLDVQKFESCLDSQKYKTRVQDDNNLAQIYGVSSTPTFFIGVPGKGFTVEVGNQPYLVLSRAIDSYLR